MKRIITILVLHLLFITHSHAANWIKLQDNKHAKLMLDKQSMTTSGKYQKAWVKMHYKAMQTNMEYAEKSYNNAKLLWYFHCEEQKSATAQVYQLLNDELVYSAAIDPKKARFLEPVPETEIDIAMRYVCSKKEKQSVVQEKTETKPETEKSTDSSKPVQAQAEKAAASDKPSTEAEPKDAEPEDASSDEAKEAVDEEIEDKAKDKKKRKVHWSYKGKKGPEFWGQLSPDFATCKTGRNQSPIDIDKTVVTSPVKLKTFHRFPATDIVNNGHSIQVNFKPGNMLALDRVIYQMKQVHFHAPSENTIHGISYPLEAHFVHVDPKGNLAVLAVMFDEGAENKGLAKLWKQIPKVKGKPKAIKSRLLPSELVPRKKMYYRYSGSLTTPPCTEGVVWVVIKTPMTASQAQIDAFKKVMRHDNNRPTQPLNGRVVIE